VRLGIGALFLVALLYGQSLGFGFVRPSELALGQAMVAVDALSLLDALTSDLSRLNVDGVGFRPDWQPLVALSFVFDGLLGAGEAWSFHLTNLLLMVALSVLASVRIPGGAGRWLVLILVVAHPMQTATVLDISARGELLLAVFATAALVVRGAWAPLWAFMAMAAHPVGIVVPILAVVAGSVSVERARRRFLAHGFALVAWVSLRVGLGTVGVVPDTGFWGSEQSVWSAAAHTWVYLQQLAVPAQHVFGQSPLVFDSEIQGLAAASLLLGALFLVRVRGAGDRPSPRVSVSIVLLPLLFSSGFLSGSEGYGEARLSWPIVGLAWLLVSRPSIQGMGWAMAPLWVGLTFFRVGDWSSSVVLWESAHRQVPSDLHIAHHLGHALRETDPPRAAGMLELVTQDWGNRKRRMSAHRGLVDVYQRLGKNRQLLSHLAVVADPRLPGQSEFLALRCKLETHYATVEAHYPVGTVAAPLAHVCRVAARSYPSDAELQNAAGMEAAVRGDFETAVKLFRLAVQLDPDNNAFRRDLAQLPSASMGWGRGGPLSPDPAAAP
jgi:hypothetical protein